MVYGTWLHYILHASHSVKCVQFHKKLRKGLPCLVGDFGAGFFFILASSG